MTKPRTMSNIDWEAPTSFHTWRKQLPIRRGRPRARSGRTTSGRRALEEATLRLSGRKTRSLGEGRSSQQKFLADEKTASWGRRSKNPPLPPPEGGLSLRTGKRR